MSGDGGEHGLNVFWQHTRVTVHQRPPLSGAQQRDRRTRRQSRFESRRLAREPHDRLHVVKQRVGGVHLRDHRLHEEQLLRRERRRQRCEQVAPILTHEQLALERRVRIAKLDPHQEAIELRLGQGIGADLIHGVLRRDDEERRCERIGVTVRGDLMLFHRFEQRALRLRRGAIDLIGEDQLREHGALVELEAARFALEDRDADDVGGQQVACELNALVGKSQRFGQRVRKRGLADAGNVFDQQVSARKEARNAQSELMLLAEDDAIELPDRSADQLDRIGLGDECRNG